MARIAESEIEMEAIGLRRQLQTGETGAIDMESLLLRNGIVTLFTDLSHDFSSMCLRYSKNISFLLVNSTLTAGERNLAIAHELYHLYVEREDEFRVHASNILNPATAAERHANTFAAHFIVPSAGMAELSKRMGANRKNLNAAHLITMCNCFQAPYRTILQRTERVLGLSKEKVEELKETDPMETARELGLDARGFHASDTRERIVGDYAARAQSLFEAGRIDTEERTKIIDTIRTIQ